jgi:hypothetical protein
MLALLVALAPGLVPRPVHVEFLDFMNQVVARHPGKQIHVILDNLSSHKPKRDLWLARDPNVHPHYTPSGRAASHDERSCRCGRVLCLPQHSESASMV